MLIRPTSFTRRCAALLLLCVAAPLALAADLPDLVARAKPSIVLVGTFSLTDAPRFQFRGTGFVVGDGNDVITNAHVLPEPGDMTPERRIEVRVWRGGQSWEPREATLISNAKAQDLVHLRINGAAVPALRLAGPEVAREGADVALIGFPIGGVLGFSHVVHKGVLAAITSISMPQGNSQGLSARAVRAIREGTFEIFQLDATAYPGNSGGPLFDVASGQVIGVLNMVLTKGARESALSNPTGISYAVPARHVVDLMGQR